MEIRHFDQLSASPAEGLAVRIWGELHEMGWVGGLGPNWDCRVVALMDGGVCVAFIAWKEQRWRGEVLVSLGGTKPGSRGHGCYRRVWDALVEHVRRECDWARAISSGYHVDNIASAAMQRALGRRVTHHITTFELR